MKKIEKRLLTHEMCVQSNNSLLKIIVSVLGIAIVIIPFLRDMEQVLKIMAIIFCTTSALCGTVILIKTLKTDKKLKDGKYFIYIDKVSDKEIEEGEYNRTYRLKFKHNKYQKPVSETVYNKTKAGTLYYLVQLDGSRKAISAFSEADYALDDSVKDKFKTK